MITTKQKIVLILQLCLAFSLFLMILTDPFMGRHYKIKRDLVLIENLTGKTEATRAQEPRFLALPPEIRHSIESSETYLQALLEASFPQKLEIGLRGLFQTSPFILAWIFVAVLLSILCLKEREGAKSALFILPLLALSFILFSVLDQKPLNTSDSDFYPTEELIVKKYLKKPLSKDLESQMLELSTGFDLWLIDTWTGSPPSQDPALYKEQIEQGKYFFNLARFKSRYERRFEEEREPKSLPLTLLFLIWNAYMVFQFIPSKLRSLGDSPPERRLKFF